MKNHTFFWFILPSLVTMVLFIAMPIGSVFIQSLHIEHGAVLTEVKNCGPFGCKMEVQVDVEATSELKKAKPLGKFNGFGTYTTEITLAFRIYRSLESTVKYIVIFKNLLNLPFYKSISYLP